jgi:hypothetical protein
MMNWIERLSKQLSLIPHSQDWGICNADASRLDKFLDFYDSHIPEDQFELEELAELILQSAEDAIATNEFEPGLGADMRTRMIKFIADHGQDFPGALEYWSTLEDEYWLVPGLIREAQSPEIARRFS